MLHSKHQRRRRHRRDGFTLMEILLVLAILVILGTTVGFFFSRTQSRAYEKSALNQINALKIPLQEYKLDVGSYPQNLDELLEAPKSSGNTRWDGPYLEEAIPADPWGNEYKYERDGTERYRISSAGPDGQPGNDDDISNQMANK